MAVIDDDFRFFRYRLDGGDIHVDGVDTHFPSHAYEEVGVGEAVALAFVENLLRRFVRQPIVGDRHAGTAYDGVDDGSRLVVVGANAVDRLDGKLPDLVVDVIGNDDLLKVLVGNTGAEVSDDLVWRVLCSFNGEAAHGEPKEGNGRQ